MIFDTLKAVFLFERLTWFRLAFGTAIVNNISVEENVSFFFCNSIYLDIFFCGRAADP